MKPVGWFILAKCFQCKSTSLDLLFEFETNVNQERNAGFGVWRGLLTTDHTVQFVLGGDNHVYSRENLITIN